MLKIDKVTTIQARGEFTKICVELDLDKPLKPKIWPHNTKCVEKITRQTQERRGVNEVDVQNNTSPTMAALSENVPGSKPQLVVMNAITWNFQGTSNKGFVPLIKDILKEYDVSLLFLLETHSSGPNVVRTIKRIWTEWVAFGGSLWSEAEIIHLPYFKSNHHPMLLKESFRSGQNRLRRPFQFMASWITHYDFIRFVCAPWNAYSSSSVLLNEFRSDLQRNQWEVVRDALFKLVREVFNDPEKVGELNKTLITLILRWTVWKEGCQALYHQVELPPVNGFKLNCDAAVNQSSGRDTVGGVFRNHQDFLVESDSNIAINLLEKGCPHSSLLREMEEMGCGHYVGHGYVSNWGMQCNSMRRRHHTGEAPLSTTAVSSYRKYLKGTESEMKRTRRVGKDKSYETEKKGSMRRMHWLVKNKSAKMTHNC
ncbi:hypothetical protein JHK86_042359 [Glycine max]|nr:hypothetical protein JHK86_042359 [Glycine max]